MSDIRTPEDEVNKVGWFTAPFKEGWHYLGATYPGHSDYAVDWNRRTQNGGWLDDTGDPVLAAADGTVAVADPVDGLVLLNHYGGLYRTEYRHMTDIKVKPGDKVQRSDRLGSIGNVAGSGASFGAHLHHRHWKRDTTRSPWRPVKMRFEDKPVESSAEGSDAATAGWNAPDSVLIEGPPPKATWESAAKEYAAALTGTETLLAKRTEQRDEAKAMTALVTEERDTARRELVASVAKLAELQTWSQDLAERFHAQTAELTESKSDLATAGQLVDTLNARIAELEAATPQDCNAEVDRALAAEQKVADAITVLTR
jgi:hypothetical protein